MWTCFVQACRCWTVLALRVFRIASSSRAISSPELLTEQVLLPAVVAFPQKTSHQTSRDSYTLPRLIQHPRMRAVVKLNRTIRHIGLFG